MLPYIHVPTDIIFNSELNNLQKNILILFYLYKDMSNQCYLTQNEIASIVSKSKQLIHLSLKNEHINKYIDIVSSKGKYGGIQNIYKLKLIPNKSNNIKFERINTKIYKQFKHNSDIVINYIKLKNAWFILKNNENADDDDYCIICNWKLNKYDIITRELKDIGLIKRTRNYEFPLEDINDEDIILKDKIKNNKVEKTNSNIANTNEYEEFFGKERAEQLIRIANKNEIEINIENLLTLHNYKTKCKREDTAESLIEYFYKQTGMLNTLKNIIKYVEKINKLIKSKGFIKTKYLVKYAVEIKNVNTLNFVETLYEQAHNYILNKIKEDIELTTYECKNIAMYLKEQRPKVDEIKQKYSEESEQYKDIKVLYNSKYDELKIYENKLEELKSILTGGN